MIGIGEIDKPSSRRGKRTREDQILFNGKLYSKNKSGYYICSSGGRKRLHVAIWEYYHKRDVPKGCAIHHLDWNKNNNNINNLICVTRREHETIHNVLGGEEGKEYGYNLLKSRNTDGTPKK